MMLEARRYVQEVESAKDMLLSWYHICLDATSQIQPPEWKDTRNFVMRPYLRACVPINAVRLILCANLRARVN